MFDGIEKATGNKIVIVDKFGMKEASARARTITLEREREPFWKAVSVLEKACETRISCIEDGVLELAPKGKESSLAHWVVPAGPRTVAGAFLLRPRFNKMSEKHVISILPEPSIGMPRFVKGYLRPASRKYRRLFSPIQGITCKRSKCRGELDLFSKSRGELDLFFSLPRRARAARGHQMPKELDMELQAKLLIPLQRKDIKLSSVKSLIARTRRRPVRVGTLLFRVIQATKEKRMGRNQFTVKLQVEKGDLDFDDVKLFDAAGKSIKAYGGSRIQNRLNGPAKVCRYFSLEQVSGDPLQCCLALHIATDYRPYILKTTAKGVQLHGE